MDINFIENNTCFILKPASNISIEALCDMELKLKTLPEYKQIALNLKNVEFICFEFLDFIKKMSKEKKLSLFNIPAEIFALINITEYDGLANIYICESDFRQNKSILINRRFSIV